MIPDDVLLGAEPRTESEREARTPARPATPATAAVDARRDSEDREDRGDTENDAPLATALPREAATDGERTGDRAFVVLLRVAVAADAEPPTREPAHAVSRLASQVTPLQRVETLDASGATTRIGGVECPRHEVTKSFDECLACGRFVGMEVMEGGRPGVKCRPGVAALARALSDEFVDRSDRWRTARVGEAMQRDVVAVRADASLQQVSDLLVARALSGIPVVNAVGQPIGMISKTDIVARSGGGRVGGRVDDAMTRLVFTLSEGVPLSRAAALMAYEGVHQIPIVSHDRTLVGLLTSLDVLRWLATPIHRGGEGDGARDVEEAPGASDAVLSDTPAAPDALD